MNYAINILCSGLLTCLAVASLPAQTISDQTLDRVLEKSGILVAAGMLADATIARQEHINRLRKSARIQTYPPDLMESMVSSIKKVEEKHDVVGKIRESAKATLTEEDGNQLLMWYESDLGAAILRDEIAALSKEGVQRAILAAPHLMNDSRRVAEIQKMVTVTEVDQMTLQMMNSMLHHYQSGIKEVLSDKYAQGTYRIPEIKNLTIQEAREIAAAGAIYSTKNYDPQQLASYVMFLESEPARKLNKVYFDAGMPLQLEMSQILGEHMAEEVKRRSFPKE